MLKNRAILLGALIGIGSALPAFGNQEFSLKVGWDGHEDEVPVKEWPISEISKIKRSSSRQKNPTTGKIENFSGVLLSAFVEKALEPLRPDQRAQVDLLILTRMDGGASSKVIIPRYLVTRYPFLLTLDASEKKSGVGIVVPWTTHPQILSESLPLETYFVRPAMRIDFASSREKYADLYLQRRTDPAALRGEKLYVQSCMSCHAMGPGPALGKISTESRAKVMASEAAHPKVKAMPKFSDRDLRSLRTYFEAFLSERGAAQASR